MGRRERLKPRERAESLLVNFWFANPVGHAIEALRYCLGYERASPDLRISLVLNGTTATELASFCPFIEKTYPVDYGFWADERDPAGALADVPREWDYVVDDRRGHSEHHLASLENLRRFYEASNRHFRTRRGFGIAGAGPPSYEPHHSLRLELPGGARNRARRRLGGARVRIAIMPAGSSNRSDYPSVKSWVSIIRALLTVYPDACFCLIGKLRRDGRTMTRIEPAEVARIAESCPVTVDCFDRPLGEQLAVVEQCQVFIAPHTGFGMAALAVGTPWLAISGGRWYEYFCNGVPFYSVLPDPKRFPAFTRSPPPPVVADDEDGEGERLLSMSYARIQGDLSELIEAAQLLIEERLTYQRALELYYPRLLAVLGGDRSRITSFDSVHEHYL